MHSNYKHIESTVLALNAEEKVRLVSVLLSNLESAPSNTSEEEWQREIKKRVNELDSGSVETIPLQQVLTEADKILLE